ncbi:MAG: TonB-dependent receptor plug domain-containing protein [Candidatus Omnitrophota bacterium]
MKISGRLFLLAAICGLFFMLNADTVNGEEIDLGKIIFSARRAPLKLSQIADNSTVVGKDYIEGLPCGDAGDVLGYIPGIDVEPRQGFGRPTSISLQGSQSRQVRVMVDGIPFNSQASGQVNLSQFPAGNIDRVEIIQGASSCVWGSGLGGVVNIITKETGDTLKPQGNALISFAEFGTQKQSLDARGKQGDMGYYFFTSHAESGGKKPKDDVLENKSFGKLSYDLHAAGRIVTSFGYSAADANTGEFPDKVWQSQPYRTRYGKISWEISGADMDSRIEFKQSVQKLMTRSYAVITDLEPYETIKTKDVLSQVSLITSLCLRDNDLLVVGTDLDQNRLESSYLTQSKNLKVQAPYVNYTRGGEELDINCGLRYDNNSEFGQDLSPSLGAVYRLDPESHTILRGTVSRTFNAPPLLWKYYDEGLSGLTISPELEAEHAYVYEIGVERNLRPDLWTRLSVYRADVYNAIAAAQNPITSQWFMKNFEKFRRQGAELSGKLDVNSRLNIFCSGGFNDIENRQTQQTVKGAGAARQTFQMGIDYKNLQGLRFVLKGYYKRWNQLAWALPNDRKMLFDAKISQQIKDITFFLNVFNITNSSYWSDNYFPDPERYFEAGISLDW